MKRIGILILNIYESENIGLVEVEMTLEDDNGDDKEFKCMMMSAEYLSHLTAQKSNAGYEKALELIREGAMTYKRENNERGKKGVV